MMHWKRVEISPNSDRNRRWKIKEYFLLQAKGKKRRRRRRSGIEG